MLVHFATIYSIYNFFWTFNKHAQLACFFISTHPKCILKLGAASPQAVKKLLALSETSKTRPKAMPSTPSPLSKGGHGHAGGSIGGGGSGSGTSSSTAAPTTSSSTSSTNHHHHQAHHHHHSLTNSVDLTAESSSVTSLPSTRKTQTNSNNNNSGIITTRISRHPVSWHFTLIKNYLPSTFLLKYLCIYNKMQIPYILQTT